VVGDSLAVLGRSCEGGRFLSQTESGGAATRLCVQYSETVSVPHSSRTKLTGFRLRLCLLASSLVSYEYNIIVASFELQFLDADELCCVLAFLPCSISTNASAFGSPSSGVGAAGRDSIIHGL